MFYARPPVACDDHESKSIIHVPTQQQTAGEKQNYWTYVHLMQFPPTEKVLIWPNYGLEREIQKFFFVFQLKVTC